MAASRTKGTYFSAKYRHIATLRGPLKAVLAVERAILFAIWHMATTGTLYDDPGADFYTRLRPERAKQRAIKQLTSMGYRVTLDATG